MYQVLYNLSIIETFELSLTLGGGFDFRYFSESIKIVLQFFSSLTSSQSFRVTLKSEIFNFPYFYVITSL